MLRWFVVLELDAAAWHATTYTKNRQWLLDGGVASQLLAGVVTLAEQHGWLSRRHFTVDGTLLEAWASHKSFQPMDGPPDVSDDDASNPTLDFCGTKRSKRMHDATSRQRGESAHAEAGGGGLWVGQDWRRAPESAASRRGARRLGVHLYLCGVQPRAPARAPDTAPGAAAGRRWGEVGPGGLTPALRRPRLMPHSRRSTARSGRRASQYAERLHISQRRRLLQHPATVQFEVGSLSLSDQLRQPCQGIEVREVDGEIVCRSVVGFTE